MSSSEVKLIRTVIAAVEDKFRDVLRGQLEREPRIRVVGEARDSQLAGSLIHSLAPDLLVIECELNRALAEHNYPNGRTSYPAPKIIAILSSAHPQHMLEALELGARSVVLKASLPPEWGPGVDRVIAGQYWITDESISFMMRATRQLMTKPGKTPLREFALTAREMEIAQEIAAGRSNRELGRQFSICERTVKHHLTNIFKKVGVSSRLELALLVRDTQSSQHARPKALGKSNVG